MAQVAPPSWTAAAGGAAAIIGAPNPFFKRREAFLHGWVAIVSNSPHRRRWYCYYKSLNSLCQVILVNFSIFGAFAKTQK